MNINIEENMKFKESFIQNLFKKELKRCDIFIVHMQNFLKLNKFNFHNITSFIKLLNKLLQNTFGEDEFPNLEDNDFTITEFTCEVGRKYFLSDEEIKKLVSPKLLKILNCIIFINQGLLTFFNSQKNIEISDFFMSFIKTGSSSKVCIFDQEKKTINLVFYLQQQNILNRPYTTLIGNVILSLDIRNGPNKDVHFVYTPIYNCNQNLLLSDRLAISPKDNYNNRNSPEILLEKVKRNINYYRIFFNLTNNIFILQCLDYLSGYLRVNTINNTININDNDNLDNLDNNGLLQTNELSLDTNCNEDITKLDYLLILLNNCIVMNIHQEHKHIFRFTPICYMISIHKDKLIHKLKAQEFAEVIKLNLFDVVKINGENLFHYKCLENGLYEMTKHRYASTYTHYETFIEYTFIITSIKPLSSSKELEKPLSREELLKLLSIFSTHYEVNKTSFKNLIMKNGIDDADKLIIYFSSFHARNILCLSLINYFINYDLETWNLFPNNINDTNWNKILHLYFITNLLLTISAISHKKRERETEIKLLINSIDERIPGLFNELYTDLQKKKEIFSIEIKKTPSKFPVSLPIEFPVSLFNPELDKYSPTNYFDHSRNIFSYFADVQFPGDQHGGNKCIVNKLSNKKPKTLKYQKYKTCKNNKKKNITKRK